MLSYLFASSWGLFVLAGLIGWGGLLVHLLSIRREVRWGERAAWGTALSVTVGAVLNLNAWISRGTIIAFLGLGAALYLAQLWRRRNSVNSFVLKQIRSPVEQPLVFVIALLLGMMTGIRYAASVHGIYHPGAVTAVNFNPHDDFYAYFVFPEKMLQTGALGPDPFSETRLISSSGGQAFLQTFVLAALHDRNLHLLDGGIALFVVLGLLIGILRELDVRWEAAAAVIFVFLWIPPPVANIAALLTSLALFLSVHRVLAHPEETRWHWFPRATLVALLSATACSLKATLIPVCVCFVAFSYLLAIVGTAQKKELIREALGVALLFVIFMASWSLSLYQSSGTLLYPLLGKGFHGSRYGTYLLPTSGLSPRAIAGIILANLTDASTVVLVLLGSFYFLTGQWGHEPRRATLSLVVAAILGKLFLTVATGGEASYRYAYPFVLAAILVLLAEFARVSWTGQSKARPAPTYLIVAILAGGLLIGASWDDARRTYLEELHSLPGAVSDTSLVQPGERDAYRRLQASIPAGQWFLERLDKPFLLDFERNRVLIADWPGGSSPPPGMPFSRGGEALGHYLLAKSIRYVAYSYASEAGFPKRIFGARLSDPNAWARTHAQHTFDFQANLVELGNTRKRLYDDGQMFVIDLSVMKSVSCTKEPLGAFKTFDTNQGRECAPVVSQKGRAER